MLAVIISVKCMSCVLITGAGRGSLLLSLVGKNEILWKFSASLAMLLSYLAVNVINEGAPATVRVCGKAKERSYNRSLSHPTSSQLTSFYPH